MASCRTKGCDIQTLLAYILGGPHGIQTKNRSNLPFFAIKNISLAHGKKCALGDQLSSATQHDSFDPNVRINSRYKFESGVSACNKFCKPGLYACDRYAS